MTILENKSRNYGQVLFENLSAILDSICGLRNLEELHFSCLSPIDDIHLANVITSHQNSLICLSLLKNRIYKNEIFKAISNCFYLKELKVPYDIDILRYIFTDSFYENNSLQRLILLKQRKFVKTFNFSDISNIISKLNHLKKVEIVVVS